MSIHDFETVRTILKKIENQGRGPIAGKVFPTPTRPPTPSPKKEKGKRRREKKS